MRIAASLRRPETCPPGGGLTLTDRSVRLPHHAPRHARVRGRAPPGPPEGGVSRGRREGLLRGHPRRHRAARRRLEGRDALLLRLEGRALPRALLAGSSTRSTRACARPSAAEEDPVRKVRALVALIFPSPSKNRAFFRAFVDFCGLAARREPFRGSTSASTRAAARSTAASSRRACAAASFGCATRTRRARRCAPSSTA